MLLSITLACFAISICAFVGVAFLYISENKINKIVIYLVSFSAGALLGGAFIHLLPEAVDKIHSSTLFLITLLAFILFFIIEKYFHWRHCHKADCETHAFGYMSLVGDAVHNFIDGLVIASTFIVNPALGVTTTIAIALHEIPQEIGDFGVLLHSGFNKKKALVVNYLVALTVVLGGIVGYFLYFRISEIINYSLPFAAGGFIYIAASDLLPEIRKEQNMWKSMVSFGIFLAGIILMLAIKE